MAGRLDADLLHRSLLAWCGWGHVGEFDADLHAVDPIALEDDHARVLGGANVTGFLVHRGDCKIALQDGVDCRLPAFLELALPAIPDRDFTPDRLANHEARFHRVWQAREQGSAEQRTKRCTKESTHHLPLSPFQMRKGADPELLVAVPLDPCALARSEEHTSELQSLRHLVCR